MLMLCKIYYFYKFYIDFFFQTELDKFMLPKQKISNSNNKDSTQVVTKQVNDTINENIDSIKARKLSHKKIKSYSLENKIKIILFNSKL